MQRESIRKAVLTEHNEVEFRLKATKPAKDFNPVVGATIPRGVKAQSMPTVILLQMPELRDYMYVKMKDQVLIVNGMTNKIVDIFPETQPLSLDRTGGDFDDPRPRIIQSAKAARTKART
jgi:hypothetical protein